MRRIVRLGFCIAIGLALLSQGALAHAEAGLTLHWDAPPDCPGAQELRAGVEGILGKPWSELEPKLELWAVVSQSKDRFYLDLRVRREIEEPRLRTVEGESCKAVVEAGAAIVALMIEDEAKAAIVEAPLPAATAPDMADATTSLAQPSPPAPSVVATQEPQRSAPTKPPREPLRRSTRKLFVESELLVDGWSLPKAAVGGRGLGGLGVDAWHASVGFFGLLPVTTDLGASATAKLWLVAGQLRGCRRASFPRAELTACATLEGGWMQGRTRGLDENGSGGTAWLTLGPEFGLNYVVARSHRLGMGLSAPIALLRKRFVIGTSGQFVHSFPDLTLRGGLGYSFEFG